jgi:hypothetical protein
VCFFSQNIHSCNTAIRIELSGFNFDERLVQHVGCSEIHITGCGKIALVGVIRTLVEIDTAHEFGNHKMQVGIALTVRMRNHVYRHVRRFARSAISSKSACFGSALFGLANGFKRFVPWLFTLGGDRGCAKRGALAILQQ